MEAAVKWLYDRHEQNETSLAIRGRKWINCVVHDQPVRVYTVPLVTEIRDDNGKVISKRDTWKEMKDVTKNGKPYSVLDCAKHFLDSGRAKGITEAARKLLEAVVGGKHVPEEEIDTRPSENVVVQLEPKRRKKCRVESAAAPKEPEKSKKSPKDSRSSATAAATGRGNLIATICTELGLEPRLARKRLRKAGLRAPYVNAEVIRKALKK